MKIVVFLNKDLEANLAYHLLKEELSKHTVRIFYSDAVGNPKDKLPELLKLEYYEKGFVYDELSRFITDHGIKSSFEFFGDGFSSFPMERCKNANSAEFIDEMKYFDPDLFISIRFGKIFKDEIVRVPKRGILNLHSAILPDYRGILGTLHAIKERRDTIGCTLHTIPDSGIDTGEIIDIATLGVDRERSLFWHVMKLYPLGARMIIKALRIIEGGGTLETKKQNLQEGNYFSLPTEEDFKKIKDLGVEVISSKDYEDLLTSLVLGSLDDSERQNLTACIHNSGMLV